MSFIYLELKNNALSMNLYLF